MPFKVDWVYIIARRNFVQRLDIEHGLNLKLKNGLVIYLILGCKIVV